MTLYAERLVEHAPADARWSVARMPCLPGDGKGRLSEFVVPPMVLPWRSDAVNHVVDHAHAGFLRYLRGPRVVTVHDLVPLKAHLGVYPEPAGAWVPPRVARMFRFNLSAISRAHAIVAPSKATAADWRTFMGDRPVHVVPHGIEPEFTGPEDPSATSGARERLGPLAEGKILLQVSNGFFYKNDAGVARTVAALVDRFPELTWVRVGPRLPQDLEEGVPSGRLRYYRPRSGADLAALYRVSTLLLLPSWDEGFGWPAVEAMACGCPVVASDRGALAEVAAPAAQVVDPTDPEDMVRGTARVLESDGLRAEFRERGHAHAGRYSWEAATAQMAEIYEEVARCGS